MFLYENRYTPELKLCYPALAVPAILCCTLLLFGLLFSVKADIAPQLHSFLNSDRTCIVWVLFTDKAGSSVSEKVSSRALERRSKAGFFSSTTDLPISRVYIDQIKRLGGTLRHEYKWENAASFEIKGSRLREIANLHFVKNVTPVGVYRYRETLQDGLGKTHFEGDPNFYGSAFSQFNLLSIPEAHHYIQNTRKLKAPGTGVLIALFDSGFRLDHRCFSNSRQNGHIIATRDFVDNDYTVFDPDSVKDNILSPYYTNDEHGSQVLSLIAGYDPGTFVGSAWGASFALARTEDAYNDTREVHVEEDNWAAAVVWAESLGVDIISSSLGYRDGFQDTVFFETDSGMVPIVDYPYSWLDGKTTIVSRAAAYAVERGIIVVNAAGNEGAYNSGTLVAPSDVKDVVSVGGVDEWGRIASFSSTGPTADGQMKPDLVAQGRGVYIPVIYGSDLSTYTSNGNGTSFSTPMIAGLCALILQSHPGISSIQARQRLYYFCRFLPDQDSVDNRFGRGIPDALLSCMRDNEIYISVTDSSGEPVRNALITGESGDSLRMTDSNGICIAALNDPFPSRIEILLSGQKEEVLIESAPCRKTVVFPVKSGLIVKLSDRSGKIIKNGFVYYKMGNAAQFSSLECDSNGTAVITMYKEEKVQIYTDAPGYINSDTLEGKICAELCTMKITMQEISPSKFLLFPTVLKKSKGADLTVEFMVRSENNRDQFIKTSIRSADGGLVWKYSTYTDPEQAFKYTIDNSVFRRLVPGLYFFIVEYGGKIYRKKILISV